MRSDQADLLALLTRLSFERRPVVLASGRHSDFYIDCKQVTLHPDGLLWLGRLLFQRILDYEKSSSVSVAGVGGLTLGADPIAAAVALISAQAAHPIPAFIVRKEPKGHGTGAYLEGTRNLPAGGELIVVEDVVTTGESALKAVRRLREAGFKVNLVLGLVDRLEGGREALAAESVALDTLYNRLDFIPE